MRDDIEIRMQHANLVRDEGQLNGLFGEDYSQELAEHIELATQLRGATNQDSAFTPSVETTSRRGRARLVLAAGVAAAIAVTIVAGNAFDSATERAGGNTIQTVPLESPDETATRTAALRAEALDTATAFVEAHNSRDISLIETLLAEDLRGGAPIGHWFDGLGGSDEYRVASTVGLAGAIGLEFRDGNCRVFSDEPLVVTCNYTASSRIDEIEGTRPAGAQFTLRYENGLISKVTMVCEKPFTPEFDAFLGAYGPLTGDDVPTDQYERLRMYVDLYERSLSGDG